jgi:hypothetical protein
MAVAKQKRTKKPEGPAVGEANDKGEVFTHHFGWVYPMYLLSNEELAAAIEQDRLAREGGFDAEPSPAITVSTPARVQTQVVKGRGIVFGKASRYGVKGEADQ